MKLRTLNRISIAVLLVVLLAVVAYLGQNPRQPEPRFSARVDVANIAHRGASGHAPENTFPAFDLALKQGAHALELDLHLSADGHVVVIHDPTVDRTTDGTGRVSEMTLQQIRQLDAGYSFTGPTGDFPFRGEGISIPTLDEVLARYPRVPMVLDIKAGSDTAIVAELVRLIHKHDVIQGVLVSSFRSDLLRRLRTLEPNVETTFGNAELGAFFVLQWLNLHHWYRPPGEILIVPERWRGVRILSQRFVRAADRLGLPVHVWTVNEPHDMRRFIDMGVAGIFTDYPDRLREVLSGRSLVLEEAGAAGGEAGGLVEGRAAGGRLDE
jgi:glycerophosphoryl diester phosphodiesterase